MAMNYLHYDFDLTTDETIVVTLDKQANVRLLDDANYSLYQKGKSHRYYGGLVTKSPYDLRVPRNGHWHLVIDLGGYAGAVTASVNVTQGV